MNKVGKNTVFNIFSKLWSMVSIYLFVPFYINFLGEESYGIVSFFATMQTAINLVGLGLSNTLKREFSVPEDSEKESRKYKLLRSVEMIYWGVALMVIFVCIMAADSIAVNWLTIETLDSGYVSQIIAIMGISIAIQLVSNLYSGCLFGLDYQSEANILNILWSAGKNCGAVLIVWLVTDDLRLFYCWHVVLDLVYAVVLRRSIDIKLKMEKTCRWGIKDCAVLKGVASYAVGVFTVSMIALVNKQLDKLLISSRLPLTELGAYNLATTLGSLTTIVSTAVFTSILPILTQLASKEKTDEESHIFSQYYKLVNIVTGCLGGFVAVFSVELVQIWTGTDAYNNLLPIVAPFVVLAVTVTEYQSLPYALALAHGDTSINVTVGLAYIPAVCTLTWVGIRYWGLVGAGVVYFILMFTQTLIYEYIVLKKHSRLPAVRNILTGFLPLFLSLVIALVVKNMTDVLQFKTWMTVCTAIVCGLTTLIVLLLLFAGKQIFNIIKKNKRNEV